MAAGPGGALWGGCAQLWGVPAGLAQGVPRSVLRPAVPGHLKPLHGRCMLSPPLTDVKKCLEVEGMRTKAKKGREAELKGLDEELRKAHTAPSHFPRMSKPLSALGEGGDSSGMSRMWV